MTFSGSQRLHASSKFPVNCPEENSRLTELNENKNYHELCLILFCSFLLRKMLRMFLLGARVLFFLEFLGLSYNFKVLVSLLE